MTPDEREQARVLVAVLKCGPTWDTHQTIAEITQLLVEAERRGAEKALREAAFEAVDGSEFTYPEDGGHVEAWLDELADDIRSMQPEQRTDGGAA